MPIFVAAYVANAVTYALYRCWGRDLKPVEIRIGWASARPGSLKQEHRRLFIRFHPQRFDDRLIRHGSQTYTKGQKLAKTFDDRLIRHGCQTSWTLWPIPSTLANRVICRGVQTPHRKSYALPRLGEPLSESQHAAR